MDLRKQSYQAASVSVRLRLDRLPKALLRRKVCDIPTLQMQDHEKEEQDVGIESTLFFVLVSPYCREACLVVDSDRGATSHQVVLRMHDSRPRQSIRRNLPS